MSPLRAQFDGKNFVPHDTVDLPEGTPVTITVCPDSGQYPLRELVELAKQLPVHSGPSDWSEQHDHYIHGAPKR